MLQYKPTEVTAVVQHTGLRDEHDIVKALKIYLTAPDLRIFEAFDGRHALDVIEKKEIHLVLMDIMMPVTDGISAMMKIREQCNVPVILLTAKSEDTDKILGLNLGADDYITKPFNPVEVTARVRALLRRYMQLGSGVIKQDVYSLGGIELDDNSKQVSVDGNKAALTPTEYEILKLLIQNAGKVYSPNEIYRLIRKEDPLGSENTIAVHNRHLREKIEIDPANPRHLKVIWGQGYMMEKERR